VADVTRLEPPNRPRIGSSRLPLGFQVVVGIGGLVVLLAIAVVIGVFLVRGLGSGAADLTDRQVEYARSTDAAALLAKAMANDERGFLLSGGKDEFRRNFERRLGLARNAFASASRSAEDVDQRHAVREARDGFEQWVQAARAEMVAFKAGNREAAVTSALGPTRDLRYTYEASLRRAQALGASAIESRSDSVSSASSQSIAILLAYLLAALVVAAVIAIWLVRTILRPVYALLTIFSEPGATERLVERYSRERGAR
jgi:methyl-accepting chemotaxis protein